MITILNAVNDIASIYNNGDFQIEKWEEYIDEILPEQKEIFLNDMNEVLRTGDFSFKKHYLPVLNLPIRELDKKAELITAFEQVSKNLDAKVKDKFGRVPEVIILLFLGLCNSSGWTMNLENTQYILLGIEKLIEQNWCDVNSLYGVIYRELGHIYRMQFGQNNSDYTGQDRFLWQLYTEGLTMLFEQKLVGDLNFFHQDKDGWGIWCKENEVQIKLDFCQELSKMTYETQRYFGEWTNYEGYSDVGSYLGARFVQWINERFTYDEMINFDISNVKKEWENYQNI